MRYGTVTVTVRTGARRGTLCYGRKVNISTVVLITESGKLKLLLASSRVLTRELRAVHASHSLVLGVADVAKRVESFETTGKVWSLACLLGLIGKRAYR